jgi:hypothetical protein
MAESSHNNPLHLGQQTNNTPGMKAIEVGHKGYSGLGFKAGQSSGERKTHHAIGLITHVLIADGSLSLKGLIECRLFIIYLHAIVTYSGLTHLVRKTRFFG